MSPFDISGLQLRPLSPEERVSYAKGYESGGEYQVPPDEGQYLLQTTSLKPKVHKEGFLAADLVATIVSNAKGDKVGEGYRVFQNTLSIKRYAKRNGSPLGDYLEAHGITFDTDNPSDREYAEALTATENRIAPANTQWEWYCKDCDENYQGQDSAPVIDGRKSFRKPCPQCKREMLANLRVRKWVSTVERRVGATA